MKSSFFFLAAMELLKLHCLASYFFLIPGTRLPILPLSLSFFFVLILERSLKSTGMRVIFYFLIQLVAFCGSLFLVLLIDGSAGGDWLALFGGPGGISPQIFIAGALAVYWLRALWLGRQDGGHEFTALRFDEGLLLFLATFSFAALIKLENSLPPRLNIPFFIFGILALGSVKAEEGRRGGLSRRSRGSMTAAAAAVFLLGALAILLLLPAIFEPAKAAAEGLKEASGFLLKVLADILVWLFSGKRKAVAVETVSEGFRPPPMAEEAGKEMSSVVMWIVVGFLSLLALAILLLLLWMLIKVLGSRTKKKPKEAKGLSLFAWLKGLWASIRGIVARFIGHWSRRRGLSPAKAAYLRLLEAGRAGGAAKGRSETPREFALRMEAQFEAARGRALPIVHALEKEVYGGAAPADSAEETARLQQLGTGLKRRKFIAQRIEQNLLVFGKGKKGVKRKKTGA